MQDTELDQNLESLLHGELKCQSVHSVDGDGPPIGATCSVKVVARKHCDCDGMTILICRNSYLWNQYVLNDDTFICESCYRDTSDCWTVTLI